MEILKKLKGKVIVSSQAMPDEPLYKEECMQAMMASCVNGGAGGLRVAGARDVRNAKKFGVPVIGLTKPDGLPANWKEIVYITPGLKEVNELIEAGADIVAFDGTLREHDNCTLGEIAPLGGQTLFQELFRHFLKSDVNVMELNAVKYGKAVDFYKKLGFKTISEDSYYATMQITRDKISETFKNLARKIPLIQTNSNKNVDLNKELFSINYDEIRK